MKIIYLSFLIFLFFTNSSFAYLDPGTGSVLLQLILGALAAGLAFVKRVRDFFLNLFTKKKSKSK